MSLQDDIINLRDAALLQNITIINLNTRVHILEKLIQILETNTTNIPEDVQELLRMME